MIILFLLVIAVVFGLAIAAFVTWAVLSERKKNEPPRQEKPCAAAQHAA